MRLRPSDVPELDAIVAERCRRSFAYFVKQAWDHASLATKSQPLVWRWIFDAICQHLEAVARKDIRFLLVNQPPRTGKTLLVGVMFPAWQWTWNPQASAIFATNSKGLADETSVACRQLIESSWYRRLFSEPKGWELREDKNVKNDWANTLGGSRFATSVGAEIIGRGAQLLVGDDIESVKTVQTEGGRKAAQQFWDAELSTRALDPATVAKILMQQRLHKKDISSHALASGRYVHLCLTNEYDPRRSCVTVVTGKEFWRDPRTVEGELLNSRGHDEATARALVEEQRNYGSGVGPIVYQAQFLQNPSDDVGGEFARKYWRFYRLSEGHPYPRLPRPEGCATEDEAPTITITPRELSYMTEVGSMDTAVEPGKESDWTVIGGVAHQHGEARRFVTDLDRQKVDIVGMENMLRDFVKRRPRAKQRFVERKASGAPLVQRLEREITGLVGVNPGTTSKVERARVHTLPLLAAGQILLPEGAPWLEVVIGEHASLPNGDFDDTVDMLSQALRMIEEHKSGASRMAASAKW